MTSKEIVWDVHHHRPQSQMGNLSIPLLSIKKKKKKEIVWDGFLCLKDQCCIGK